MKEFIPARLVQSESQCYIVYYQTNPASGKRERHRETFDLGRIPLAQRADIAADTIRTINARLPFGYPFDENFYAREVTMTVTRAFEFISKLGTDLRHASRLSYDYAMRKFLKFLAIKSLEDLPVDKVTKKIAFAYSDFLINEGLAARTHNNEINDMKRMFYVLTSREIISANPFKDIPKLKVSGKARRTLTPDEVSIIFSHLPGTDKSVYLQCALLYFCFIRPNEQRFLRVRDINLSDSVIFISGEISKNRKDAYVTITDQLRDILIALGFNTLSPSQYIIGSAARIGADRPVGKSSVSNRYREIIKSLYKRKILTNIDGNCMYSWKDTGATALGRSGINGLALKDQMRHHSLAQCQQYIDTLPVANEFIKSQHRIPLHT